MNAQRQIKPALKMLGMVTLSMAAVFGGIFLMLFLAGCSSSHSVVKGQESGPIRIAEDRPVDGSPMAQVGPSYRQDAGEYVVAPIYFDYDKYELRPQDAPTLALHATVISTGDDSFVLEGH